MYNGHGDVTALVDATTGTVEAAYYYDAFGNVVNALIHGDVTGDGVITSSDYAWVLRYCLDMTTEFPSPFGKLAADVDGDNNITDTDLAYIQEKILGMIEYFPADTNKDCYTDSKNPYGYAGYQYDRETGLYYLNARMYDPVTARFMQEDTYRGDGLNLYAYVGNNPVNYYDPSGYSSCGKKTNPWNDFQKANKGKYASPKEAAEAYKALNKPKGVTYEGSIYRNVNSAYDPLEMNSYTINSNHRYTQPGTPGLYFGDSEKTVFAELGSYKVTDYSNRTMHSYDAKLDNMLDLTDSSVRKQLGVKKADLLTNDYRKNVGSATTHQMGEYALKNEYNGLIVPSARNPGGNNIVIFDPNLIN